MSILEEYTFNTWYKKQNIAPYLIEEWLQLIKTHKWRLRSQWTIKI